MFDHNGLICTDILKASVELFSPDEIKRVSVIPITSTITFDSDGSPRRGGLHDPSMGPMDFRECCATCGYRRDCFGHLGRIDLALPAYNPTLVNALIKLLKLICFRCKRLRLQPSVCSQYVKKFQLVQSHMLEELELFSMIIANPIKTQPKKGSRSAKPEIGDANTQLQLDKSSDSRKEALLKILHRLHTIRKSQMSEGGSGVDVSHGISETGASLEAWMSLRKELFMKAKEKKSCTHCGRSFDVYVKLSRNYSGIELYWNVGSNDPLGPANSIARSTDEEDENYFGGEEEDVPTGRLVTHYGKRGKVSNTHHLQAFQLVDIVKKLFTSPDAELLELLFPMGKKASWKMFFIESIPVTANRFRPLMASAHSKGDMLHPRTAALLDILRANEKVAFTLKILEQVNPLEALKDPKFYLDVTGVEMSSIGESEKKALTKAIVEHEKSDAACVIGYSEEVQMQINGYVDKNRAQKPGSAPAGIRQWIERKQGAFRQKMMGKRVNFSARTVIAPDCYISTNEIGIPVEFAKKLTIPEYVTAFNASSLRQLVENGAGIYPGANAIQDSLGNMYNLEALDAASRRAHSRMLQTDDIKGSYPRIVFRHLQDGDVVLANRQPTLHKPGIMAHFVKVLASGYKVFRLHYVNCSTYNADFDGDEMNIHVPQDLKARAEARYIANADCQFNVPKNGEPLRGLIQDHVQGGVLLTNRGTFLDVNQYHTLVYAALNHFVDSHRGIMRISDEHTKAMTGGRASKSTYDGSKAWQIDGSEAPLNNPFFAHTVDAMGRKGSIPIEVEPPAVMKPKKLWTGKQVITTILKTIVDTIARRMCVRSGSASALNCFHGINMKSKSKTPGDAWGGVEDGDKEESTIIIQDSELLQGVLDKSQYGPSSFGLVHLIFDLLGPAAAGMMLNSFARLFTTFLQMRGATCSVGDFLMNAEGEEQREHLIRHITVAGTYLQEMIVDSLTKSSSDAPIHTAIAHKEALAVEKLAMKKKMTKLLPLLEEGGDLRSLLGAKEGILGALQPKGGFFSHRGKILDDGEKAAKLSVPPSQRQKPHLLLDWRSKASAKERAGMLRRVVEELRRVGKTTRIKGKLIDQMMKSDDILKIFPRLRDVLLKKKSSNCLGSSGKPTSYSRSIARTVQLPNGLLIKQRGAERHPRLYHPSWLWVGSRDPHSLPFEDASRYSSRLLRSIESSKLFHLCPSDLTRTRIEALVRRQFKGSETSVYAVIDHCFQASMGKIASRMNDLVTGKVSLYKFPSNGFASMVITGAKGSKVNYGMITGMLGQQSLEGKRVPVMVSGRTLSSFARYDLGARAGGLITDRFLSGLRPQEYYFHCMSGREGLIDTAVKTAKSGYLQRCIMKGMEGVSVRYDGTVRDSDDSIIQFTYGEDGLDVSKTSYIGKLEDLLMNPSILRAKFRCKEVYQHQSVKESLKKVQSFLKMQKRISADSPASSSDIPSFLNFSDPLTSVYQPACYLGSVTENYRKTMLSFLNSNFVEEWKTKHSSKSSQKARKELEMVLLLKYNDSICSPGEAVGCIAAQSLGEPATQMTLNTFHLAGHGAANVTMGIPRLREILQTAGKPSTPYLYVPLKGKNEALISSNTQAVLQCFRKIDLTDVVHAVGVESNLYYQPITWTPSTSSSTTKDAPNLEESTQLFNYPPQNMRDSYSFRKFWHYEATIQFENLLHFCQVTPQFTPQKIVHFTVGTVVSEFLKEVARLLVVTVVRNGAYEPHSASDELQQFFQELVLSENAQSNREKQQHLKDVSLMATRGKGKTFDDRFEALISAGREFSSSDALIGKSQGSADAESAGGFKREKNGEEVGNYEIEEEEDGTLGWDQQATAANGGDAAEDDENSDAEKDDSEAEFSESEIDAAEALDEDEVNSQSSSDEAENANMSEKQKERSSRENLFSEDDDPSAKRQCSDELADKVIARTHEAASVGTQWYTLDPETRLMIEEELLNTVIPSSLKECVQLNRKGFRSVSAAVCQFLHDIYYCPKTSRLVIKFGWPISKCPYQIEFLDILKQLVEKNKLAETLGVANPRIVSGTNTTTGMPYEMQCQGSDFAWIHQLKESHVEHSKIYSNDIKAILNCYGVEAARSAVIRELNKVFSVYGIKVDYRHLSLISDYMTSAGGFRPFNRLGVASHSSPFLQMSFETSMNFLNEACLRGAYDNLKTPAGSIVTGKSTVVGTGYSKILIDLMSASETAGKEGLRFLPPLAPPPDFTPPHTDTSDGPKLELKMKKAGSSTSQEMQNLLETDHEEGERQGVCSSPSSSEVTISASQKVEMRAFGGNAPPPSSSTGIGERLKTEHTFIGKNKKRKFTFN